MRTLVTVGTDDGLWAPPRSVELTVTFDAPSGLGITNAEPVRWLLSGDKATIVSAAIAVGDGGWARIDMAPTRVGRHNREAIIAAGSIVIDVGLVVMSTGEIRSQGLLEGRLRELPE